MAYLAEVVDAVIGGDTHRDVHALELVFFRFLIFANDGERGWEDAMRNPIEFLVQQQTNTPNREQLRKHPYGRRILRSWYSTRLTVGILGIAMPFALIIGDLFVLEGSAWTRGSLSAYYHSGVRDVFVGVLCIVGVFLISYRMSDWRHPDSWLSTAAGIAALLVAFFPTTTGDGEIPTPLVV
jgi:hypothetical protein